MRASFYIIHSREPTCLYETLETVVVLSTILPTLWSKQKKKKNLGTYQDIGWTSDERLTGVRVRRTMIGASIREALRLPSCRDSVGRFAVWEDTEDATLPASST